jgi:hypothetical protein
VAVTGGNKQIAENCFTAGIQILSLHHVFLFLDGIIHILLREFKHVLKHQGSGARICPQPVAEKIIYPPARAFCPHAAEQEPTTIRRA